MKDSYQFSVVSYQLLVVSWKCLGKRGSVNLLGNVGNVGKPGKWNLKTSMMAEMIVLRWVEWCCLTAPHATS